MTDAAGNTDTDTITVEVLDEESEDPSLIQVGANESQDGDSLQREATDEPLPEGLRIDVQQLQAEGGDGPAVAVGNHDIQIENAPDDSSLSLQLNDDSRSNVDSIGNVISDRLDVDIITGGDFDMAVETREIELEAVTAAESSKGSVGSASGDSTASVANGTDSTGDVSVSGVDRETVDMTVDALTDDGKDFVDATGARPAGYIEVDHSIAERDIDGATHHFRVRQSYLDATGVGPEDVQLYRDEDSGWNDLETRYAGESDGFHYTRRSHLDSRCSPSVRTPPSSRLRTPPSSVVTSSLASSSP